MKWKKKFNEEFGIATFTWNGNHETGLDLANKSRKRVKNFISQEIIEKLTRDIISLAQQYDGAEGGWGIQFQQEAEKLVKYEWL